MAGVTSNWQASLVVFSCSQARLKIPAGLRVVVHSFGTGRRAGSTKCGISYLLPHETYAVLPRSLLQYHHIRDCKTCYPKGSQ